jgi:glycosyltransferase involved in cell wall biosynthesis
MNQGSPEKYKVFFLTMVPFPHGMAQTNRLISIASGLIEAGCDVTVICLKPSENHKHSLNSESHGTFHQIKFVYSPGTTFRGKNPLRRFCLYMAGIISATCFMVKENHRTKIQSTFIGVTGSLVIFWFFLVCSLLNIKYLQERSEYPFIKARKSWMDKFSLLIYLRLICKLFDGFLAITKKLKDYFTPNLRKNCPVFLLPILVEPERFDLAPKTSHEKYIAYCGSMQGDKDGIPVLIDAFKLISEEYPDLKLYLIGSTQFAGFNTLKEKINRLQLETNIEFTGIAGREKLPGMLANAVMLVLARPENKQAEAGFPTKLGEYLATGRPVVVTSVGEIPDYLQDNINAYIAKPNDAEDFANKMRQVLQNYKHAQEVGLQGRALAQTVFNYKVQGRQLAKWLEKI